MILIIPILFLTIFPSSLSIPTTLDGPFEPVTRRLDPTLRLGSDDVALTDPRLAKKVGPNFPEQIALATSFSPTSIWVSWVTGDAKVGSGLTPLDPSAVRSEVWYGEESGKYGFKEEGEATVYAQLYPYKGLLNYTSAIIHHVRLQGLQPGKRYYYKCGDSSLHAMSEEHSFETLPSPGLNNYPRRIAVIGDLGLTFNSTTTIEHLAENDPSMILMVGDLSYANQYMTTGGKGASCYSCAFPDAPIRETYQPRWDGWGRFMEPLTSKIPLMVIEGNHEIEPQIGGMTFQSYLTRFSVPSKESGSNTNFYYSFNVGGVHFIMLGAYVDYNQTGAQYTWLRRDLSRIDRQVTPWVVASWHAPWYNSYSSHYQEFECMRQEMEELLYQHRVDIVFSGHVHAYERMNRVYNYTLDSCGPVFINVGDGGNIEKIDVDHADDPGKCPSQGDNVPEFGGVCHLNFSSGPAKGKFCWEQQPEWSAFRESSFGHGILEVINSTYALWTWHRNQDVYKENSRGDQIYIVRQPDVCVPPHSENYTINSCCGLAAWEAGKPLVIERVEVAPPEAMEVRVKIKHTSLCHTDIYFWEAKDQTPLFPRIFGHEAAGIVESVGEGVEDLKAGDHVLPVFTGECGECRHCKSEESNMCDLLRINTDRGVMISDEKSRFSINGKPINHFLGTSTFSEYTVLHSGSLAKIPRSAPLDKVCILSCGISTGLGATLNVAKPKKGSTVAIFGLGAVGLGAAEGARISGASRIIGVDMNPKRFEEARKFGVTEFVNPKDHDRPVQEVLAEMTEGGADRSVECTGNINAMISAFECVHDGWGVAVLVGVPNKDAVFMTKPTNLLNERTLKGTFFGNYKPRSDLPSVVDMYMKKELQLEKFITHRVTFAEINKAFDYMLRGEGLRCIISMDE